LKFDLVHTDIRSAARAGLIATEHGVVETPIFMPVGTQGSVKAVEQRELEEIGTQIILANTYHLYLRPGTEIIARAGGLHRFMGWKKPILTDSGGFQVFSLASLSKVSEEGVRFQSHIDGSPHSFTPERVIQMERIIGADIVMVLDECTPYPCELEYARESNERTLRWAERCRSEYERSEPPHGCAQALFGIVQGSTYPEVREHSSRSLASMSFDGYAIGGLAVGEPVEIMYEITKLCSDILPEDKPRYLMGVGTPENLLESIERGMDMFDCVLPTRNGRNAMAFTKNGSMSIKNAMYKEDFRPIDEECKCYTCRSFTRAYLRHLFLVDEILPLQLTSLHNLHFYLYLMGKARRAILRDGFSEWKREALKRLSIQTPESQ
jgi:queuine tRNA-ribosyltransferase